MTSDISTNYRLDIEVLTPLHVGNGNELKRDFDFVTQDDVTYVLNVQKILDDFWTDDPDQQHSMMSLSMGELIARENLARHKDWVVHAYRGTPNLGLLREHIRDPFNNAYLPGSSIKGALRTALLRTVQEGVKRQPYARADVGPGMIDLRDSRAAKGAANTLERRLAGIDPNHSVFRGVQVSDTNAVEKALAMCNVQMAAQRDAADVKAIISLEIINPRTQLRASLKLDRYVLEQQAAALGLDDDMAKTTRRFVRAARFTTEDRARKELAYHQARHEYGDNGEGEHAVKPRAHAAGEQRVGRAVAFPHR